MRPKSLSKHRRCGDCREPFAPDDPRQNGRCDACKVLGQILLLIHSQADVCEADRERRESLIPFYAAVVARGGLLFENR